MCISENVQRGLYNLQSYLIYQLNLIKILIIKIILHSIYIHVVAHKPSTFSDTHNLWCLFLFIHFRSRSHWFCSFSCPLHHCSGHHFHQTYFISICIYVFVSYLQLSASTFSLSWFNDKSENMPLSNNKTFKGFPNVHMIKFNSLYHFWSIMIWPQLHFSIHTLKLQIKLRFWGVCVFGG